jgi:hypothetical protein
VGSLDRLTDLLRQWRTIDDQRLAAAIVAARADGAEWEAIEAIVPRHRLEAVCRLLVIWTAEMLDRG